MLLFADGFEDGSAAWTLTGAAVGTGRFGNGIVTSSTAGTAETGFTATAGPIIIGFAVKPPSNAAMNLAAFMRAAFAPHVGLSRGAAGELIVYRAALTSTLGTSAANVLPANAWSYVEAKVVIHDTAGSVAVRVNGVQVLNLTNVDTKDAATATTASVILGSSGAVATVASLAFDDVYLCDATGTVNTDSLGELTVEHLRPGSDDTAQWVGTDGNSVNNYDLVDEAGTANTADYVGSATVGARDLYVPVASIRPGASPVLGVVVAAVAQKSDAGVRTARLVVKEGAAGTVRTSAELGLPTTFGELRAVFDRKADGSAFSLADVNALRFGIEVAT